MMSASLSESASAPCPPSSLRRLVPLHEWLVFPSSSLCRSSSSAALPLTATIVIDQLDTALQALRRIATNILRQEEEGENGEGMRSRRTEREQSSNGSSSGGANAWCSTAPSADCILLARYRNGINTNNKNFRADGSGGSGSGSSHASLLPANNTIDTITPEQYQHLMKCRRINVNGEYIRKMLLPAVMVGAGRGVGVGADGAIDVDGDGGDGDNCTMARKLKAVQQALGALGFVPSTDQGSGVPSPAPSLMPSYTNIRHSPTPTTPPIQLLELPLSADLSPLRAWMRDCVEPAERLVARARREDALRHRMARWLAAAVIAGGGGGGSIYNNKGIHMRAQCGDEEEDAITAAAVDLLQPVSSKCATLCMALVGIIPPAAAAGAAAPTNAIGDGGGRGCDEEDDGDDDAYGELLSVAYQKAIVTIGSVFEQERLWGDAKRRLLLLAANYMYRPNNTAAEYNAPTATTVKGIGRGGGSANPTPSAASTSTAPPPPPAAAASSDVVEPVTQYIVAALHEALARLLFLSSSPGQNYQQQQQQQRQQLLSSPPPPPSPPLLQRLQRDIVAHRIVPDLVSVVDAAVAALVDEVASNAKTNAIANAKRRAAAEHREEYLFGGGGGLADANMTLRNNSEGEARSGTFATTTKRQRTFTRVDPERLFTAVSIIADISALMERCAMVTNSFARFHRTASLALLETFKDGGGRDFAFLYAVKEEWEAKLEALRLAAGDKLASSAGNVLSTRE